MELTPEDKHQLIEELLIETGGKLDGSRKNILISECPHCGHSGNKFGIYVGPETRFKKFGSSHCFYCGRSCRTLEDTFTALNIAHLIPSPTNNLNETLDTLNLFEDEEFDDDLDEISLPEHYKRTFKNRYLKSRGFWADDYEYFPVGTTRCMNREYDEYVIFPIIMDKKTVGYVSRHTWSKDDIDYYNDRHHYKIRRYKNSVENGFARLLYNYDAVISYKTDTVVLCEGVFDVIGLTRGLDLYDNERIQAVATFGKKISQEQMYLLQKKGVNTIVIGYDNDDAAAGSLRSIASMLEPYFDVYAIKYPRTADKDFGEMEPSIMYDLFSDYIVTPREIFLS